MDNKQLRRVFELVDAEFSGVTFEVNREQSEDGMLVFTADISAEKYFDDGIYARCTCYASGVYRVQLVFDSIGRDLTSLQMVNDFNENLAWFKAFVSHRGQKDFLELEYFGRDADTPEKMAASITKMLIQPLEEDTLKYLIPLTKITQ